MQLGKQPAAAAAGDAQPSEVAVPSAPLSPAKSESGDAPSETDAASDDELQQSESTSDAVPADR